VHQSTKSTTCGPGIAAAPISSRPNTVTRFEARQWRAARHGSTHLSTPHVTCCLTRTAHGPCGAPRRAFRGSIYPCALGQPSQDSREACCCRQTRPTPCAPMEGRAVGQPLYSASLDDALHGSQPSRERDGDRAASVATAGQPAERAASREGGRPAAVGSEVRGTVKVMRQWRLSAATLVGCHPRRLPPS